MLYMRRSSKYWLLGSICIIVINLVFFLFRNYVQETVLLWVVIMTPLACLLLYPLTCLLDKDNASGRENSTG
jgi:hypothetical protein